MLCLLPLLAACSKAESDAFFEGLAQVIILLIVASLVATCIGLALMALQLVVVVLNFARPSKVSMVTGYVLAGLHGLSLVGSVVTWSLTPPEPASADALVTISTGPSSNLVLALVMSAAFAGLLGGSAYYAQRKLFPTPPVATEG